MCLEKSASEALSAISIMLGSTNGTMLLLVHSLHRLGNTRCMFTRCRNNDHQVISINSKQQQQQQQQQQQETAAAAAATTTTGNSSSSSNNNRKQQQQQQQQ